MPCRNKAAQREDRLARIASRSGWSDHNLNLPPAEDLSPINPAFYRRKRVLPTVPLSHKEKVHRDIIAKMKTEAARTFGGQEYNRWGRD